MPSKFPVELWDMIISNHDSHDRSQLLPLQLASRQLHALVTLLIYTSISITYSGSDDLIQWIAAHGRGPLSIEEGLDWEPQVPYTTFSHISIPLHRLSKLHATFTNNPSLVTYTASLVLNPFYQGMRHVDGRWEIVQDGWEELCALLPFFVNIQRVSVGSEFTFPVPSDILCSLPTAAQLTHLEIFGTTKSNDVLALLERHPNLQCVSVPGSKPLPISGHHAVGIRRLVSLEVNARFWTTLCRRRILPMSSLSSLQHLSFSGIPNFTTPISILRDLLSFQVSSTDLQGVAHLVEHLSNVEYVSITAVSSEGIPNIDALFNIPSKSLKHINLESYWHSEIDTKTPAVLFDLFEQLTIVDVDIHADEDSCVMRLLRDRKSPVKMPPASLRPFQKWWERAGEEVENVLRNQ